MNVSIITLRAILRQLDLQMSDKAITKNERISKATLLKIRNNVASIGLSLSELLEKQESELEELFQITKYKRTCKKPLISLTLPGMVKMDIKVCFNKKFDLSNSFCTDSFSEQIANVNGVGIFDINGKILPLISKYISYQTKHEKIAVKSSATYAKNLAYFLEYIRNREDYDSYESDDVFFTVPKFIIQEYLSYLSQNGLSSTTIRNRDATLKAFINFLCDPSNGLPNHRDNNPYQNGYLSKTPKRTKIESCSLDELLILINSTPLERERTLLQFLFDSGLRRSELPRVSLEDFNNVVKFNSQKFIVSRHDQPIQPNYLPLRVKGSKGRGNEIKPRWTLISSATLKRIQRYHASPLYKKYLRKFKSSAETPAFLNAEGTKYTSIAINKLLERLSKRAIKKGLLSKVISPHKLRHGNAYAILQSPDLGNDYLERLIVVQKNFGHNHLDTTEMYTNIPPELYNSICDEKGELLTRAEKMKRLSEQTTLKIDIRAKK